MSIPREIFNKIMLYNSHPVADVFKSGYLEELKDYEFGQTTDYFNFSFCEVIKMTKEANEAEKESKRQWNLYRSKYAYYDDDE